MNLYTLRKRVLQQLNESTSSPQFWTEPDIDDFLNEGYDDLILNTRVLESSAVISLVANQYIYDLAGNCLYIIRMYYETDDMVIRPMSWGQLQRKDHWWVDTTHDYPRYYIPVSNQNVFLYPRVTSAESSAIIYWFSAMGQEMTQETDLPDMRSVFHDALVDYGMGLALLRQRAASSYQMALKYLGAYEEKKYSLKTLDFNRANRPIQLGEWP